MKLSTIIIFKGLDLSANIQLIGRLRNDGLITPGEGQMISPT